MPVPGTHRANMRDRGLALVTRFLVCACLIIGLCALLVAAPCGPAVADEPAGSAPASDEGTSAAPASGSSDNAGGLAQRADDRPVAKRAQDAIGTCIAGLFTGWGVADPASFYDSDMLLIDDGSCVWLAFDVYRAGGTEGYKAFLERMERHVSESYAGDERGLDSYSPTTWSRVAVVVGTMGANPQAFGKDADGNPANLLSDGLYNWSYTKNLSDQGSNALIYSLQAIDALQVAVPANAKYSAEDVLDGLLECQAEDGSFALSPGSRTGSVDLTGMALAALAPYRDLPEVGDAVDAAVEYLAAEQAANGSFAAEGESTSESCSMAIIGLSACGIDVTVDKRFAKEGGSPIDALLKFQKPDGTFAHLIDDLSDDKVRDLPTEQGLRALLSFVELQQGGDGNVYTHDITLDVWKVQADEGTGEPGSSEEDGPMLDTGWVPYLISIGIGAVIGLMVVMALWFVGRIRRKARR